jgi:hypothetical protein
MTHTSNRPEARRTIVLLVMAMLAVARVALAEDVGWVAAVDGTAEVQRGGAWTALAQGATVQLGDHVRTAAASRLKLLFRDDSVVTLGERSELVIDAQMAGAAPSSSFSLMLGKMRAVVADRYGASGAKFEVKSPTAIAGVRGTSFFASYDKDRDETQVVGLESITAVRGVADTTAAREVKLGPGMSTIIGRGKTPSLPVKLPGAEIQSLTTQTSTQAKGPGDAKGAADPRLPRQPGARDGSPEGRVVDQPVELLRQRGVQPPPPPVR